MQREELVRLDRQSRQIVSKGFGNHVSRLAQMLAGVNEVARCLHCHRAANVFQNTAQRVSVGQRVFARVQRLAGDQRQGEGPGAFDLGLMDRHALNDLHRQMG